MQLTVGTQGWLSIWKAVITGQTGKIVCICGNTFCEIQHSSFRKKKKKKNTKKLFFFFLHLWHMDVPRLGIYATATATPDPGHGIQAASATYTIAHGSAGSLTH